MGDATSGGIGKQSFLTAQHYNNRHHYIIDLDLNILASRPKPNLPVSLNSV